MNISWLCRLVIDWSIKILPLIWGVGTSFKWLTKESYDQEEIDKLKHFFFFHNISNFRKDSNFKIIFRQNAKIEDVLFNRRSTFLWVTTMSIFSLTFSLLVWSKLHAQVSQENPKEDNLVMLGGKWNSSLIYMLNFNIMWIHVYRIQLFQ